MFNKIYAFLEENFCTKEIIILIIFTLAINIEFPYYIDVPGGTIDLATRIEVVDSKPINGSLNSVYVSELKATIPTLIASKFNDEWEITKIEDVLVDNETKEDVNIRGQLTLKTGVNNATYYAYQKAGKELTVKAKKLYIYYIHDAAKTDLKVGDQLISIDDKEIVDEKDISEIINNHNIGDKIKMTVQDKHGQKQKYFEIINYEDSKKIGVNITTIYDYGTDQKVKFKYLDSEGGSSGGLMNTLYIYSSLIEEDIVKGKKIIGTGTIEKSGLIGSIGGIKFKVKSAFKAKADVFFVPAGSNCEEAEEIKKDKNYKLNLVCVNTFNEVVDYLKNN